MGLVDYILHETAWLYTRVYQNHLFFFDLWSIVHFWCGFVLMMLLTAFHFRRTVLYLLLILFAYELAEILFILFAFNLFRPETIKDQFTDMFLGLAGGLLSYLLFQWAARYRHDVPGLILLGLGALASMTYAFPWVGFYHYHYDVESFNTGGGMNFYTYITWTVTGILILLFYYLFRKMKFPLRLLLTWTVYFTGLSAFEFITYYLLNIHEDSLDSARPMFLGIIHGSGTMHVFYVLVPFIIILLYSIAIWLANRIISRINGEDEGKTFSDYLCWKG